MHILLSERGQSEKATDYLSIDWKGKTMETVRRSVVVRIPRGGGMNRWSLGDFRTVGNYPI